MKKILVVTRLEVTRLIQIEEDFGPRFSNIISQTLLVFLKRLPPKGKKLLVFGTTSELTFLDSVGICNSLSVTYSVPTLRTEDAKKYKNVSPDYLKNVWKVINWKYASEVDASPLLTARTIKRKNFMING